MASDDEAIPSPICDIESSPGQGTSKSFSASGGNADPFTGAGTYSSSSGVVSEQKCRGCSYNKSSLRGHLAQTTKNCRSLYTEHDLIELERNAKSNHKEKIKQNKKLKRETSHVVCYICDKQYADKYVLDQHVAQVHNQETLKCPECAKSFQRKSNLRDHLHTVHGDDKDIFSKLTICKYCNKEFTLSQNLDRHIVEQHLFPNNHPRIKCTECDDTFTRRESMTSHREREHYATSGFHKCGICEMIFSNTGNVNRHIKIVHGGEKIHACQQCSAHYSCKKHLENHIKKGKHYRDGICPHCEERVVIKSEASWRDHFIKEPKWRKFETGWKEMACGKETCVNKLKKQREQMKEFPLRSTLCVHCNEVVPNKDADEHWLLWDVEAPEKNTCITNVSRRESMICWYCKGEIITKDYIDQIRLGWKFVGNKHPDNAIDPSSCKKSIGRGRNEHDKKEKEIELKREQRLEKRGILQVGDEGYEMMRCMEEKDIELMNW